jgi:hypothetical protein
MILLRGLPQAESDPLLDGVAVFDDVKALEWKLPNC